MRASIAILLFIVCCYSSPLQEAEYQSLFTKWAVTHGKNYELDTFFKRYSIFKQNLDYINDHSAKNSSYEMAMNSFGDLTFEEFSATYTGLLAESSGLNTTEPFDIPSSHSYGDGAGGSFDWRTRGVINSVQNQGACGSCYAFTGIAVIEAAWAITKGVLKKLSEQQIVDCSRNTGNAGCSGGCIQCVYSYVIKQGSVAAANYPYTAKEGTCKASSYSPAVKISKYQQVNRNEGAMLTAVKIQPLAIAVAASKPFQFYSKGVFDDSSCGTKLDHGVNIIGFGTVNGKDYWIIRNSWGTGWGESGYIRVVRNKNMCGLATDPSYPIV